MGWQRPEEVADAYRSRAADGYRRPDHKPIWPHLVDPTTSMADDSRQHPLLSATEKAYAAIRRKCHSSTFHFRTPFSGRHMPYTPKALLPRNGTVAVANSGLLRLRR